MQKRPLIFTILAVAGYFAALHFATFLKLQKMSGAVLEEALRSESAITFSGTLITTMVSGEKKYVSRVQTWQSGGTKYIHKGKRTFTVPLLSKTETEKLYRQILKNYSVKLLSDAEKVAGRETYALFIQPKHPGSPSKKLWVDKMNFFVLKKEDFDSAGKFAARSVFDSVAYTDVKDARVHMQNAFDDAHHESETMESLSKKLNFKVREPRQLPEGYTLERCRLFICPDHCGMKAAQLVYSDGLNSFSVFEVSPEKSGCTKLSHCYKMCSLKNFPECLIYKSNPFATVVSLASTNPTYVFVGNLPKEMFLQMAEAIRKGAGGSVQGVGGKHEH